MRKNTEGVLETMEGERAEKKGWDASGSRRGIGNPRLLKGEKNGGELNLECKGRKGERGRVLLAERIEGGGRN